MSGELRWEKVCQVADIPDGGVVGLEVEDTPVALVRTGGEVFALRDVCSHAEVRLSEGEVYDNTLECWLHGSCFDLRSGKPTGPPATRPVNVYRVKIEGDDVYVSLSKE
ncbi:non-heme iron oxygenase ferredoxin subunit [Microbispora triticiradicis]|uniref:Non-heme iron oxygenase ferredoxin subunit n=3 Tax=Microbispora TaxID=2005 RepID=A0ABY3LXB4_9ACTN|nr:MULTISPECIES: non-heme iron oxygenase ferredoxin subunit [Microbispora]RGA00851.1 non-heme iron oxygenase ferredoxin subunit [Microbispora triticiradicis]TLP59853.1 non-heme iron oxygenase ferredoxin subunit [Microbispora fusca]TYB58213.1 non-heme iron oxygenase ferredoxin subunit [Microbispora tritici]GLW23322.1 (2Fe-2S)-binding protein [Microbispora amethystogenes]